MVTPQVVYRRLGNFGDATSTTLLHQWLLWDTLLFIDLLEFLPIAIIVLTICVAAIGFCCRWPNRKYFLAAAVLPVCLVGSYIVLSRWQDLIDVWRSPSCTKALALIAIALMFCQACFGPCRRWSSGWIVQYGFLAGSTFSLPLAAYTIGRMQSSAVKSEMYPVWAVSLLALYGCVDSAAVDKGRDYKSPLFNLLYNIGLYCGYVLMMSSTTIPTDDDNMANKAVVLLTAITVCKGIHRSMALVLPRRMKPTLQNVHTGCRPDLVALAMKSEIEDDLRDGVGNILEDLIVDLPPGMDELGSYEEVLSNAVSMADIQRVCKERDQLQPCQDVCLSFSLSHLLHGHILGLSNTAAAPSIADYTSLSIDYKWVFKFIEVELAFLYDVFFTGNAFHHYYQAKSASFWACASLIGICFVGVAVAIPGTMNSPRTADLTITLFILVSLAILQLVQLIWSWTSNWARVALACDYARKQKDQNSRQISWSWWIRLRAFVVTRTNWFDSYLWQDKLGQHSLIDEVSSSGECMSFSTISSLCGKCAPLLEISGLQYIGQVLRDLCGSGNAKGDAIRLDDKVKQSIADFIDNIENDKIGHPLSLFIEDNAGLEKAEAFVARAMGFYISTWYCELADQRQEQEGTARAAAGVEEAANENRHVAIVLSKYCAYLVVSAPELLPGVSWVAKHIYNRFVKHTRSALSGAEDILQTMDTLAEADGEGNILFVKAVKMGKDIYNELSEDRSNLWRVLACSWVQALVYAAPYGEVEAHMQHLSQGGELITHLWALLFHFGIYKWQPKEDFNINVAHVIMEDDS
ncbi:unnamed protein product [Urochloa decumbens]